MVKDKDGNETELLCLACNKPITLPKYIVEDYKGEVGCQECGYILYLKLEDWYVREYRIIRDNATEMAAKKTMEELRKALQEPERG